MNAIKTNWVNIVGIFLVILTCVFFNALFHSATLVQAVFGTFLVVCAYGFMFWGGFMIALVVLDVVLIIWDQRMLRVKLLIEWLLISAPFIYWTVKYNEWIFAVGIVSFLITQFFREQKIRRIQSN